MKILALDVGAGTEDVLLYDDERSIENCVKMVLPSPSQVFASKVAEATRLSQNLFVKGDTIGGGALASALRKHVDKGHRVVMTENAAYTIRNDLEEVKDLGIEIVPEDEGPVDFDGLILKIEEVNLEKLGGFLKEFNEALSDVDVVAVAVQDHGVFPKGMSNRRFRIQKMRKLLERNPKPEFLAFREHEIPSCFRRMRSAARASRRQLPDAEILVMDTSPVAILGCLMDPSVEKSDNLLVTNVGNGHTIAATVSDGKLVGVMEHHTRLLGPQKIEEMLINLADGKLVDEKVFQDGGHGAFYLGDSPGFSEITGIVATGPNRRILGKTRLSVRFAAPAGDVMMTGPVGLIEATKKKFA